MISAAGSTVAVRFFIPSGYPYRTIENDEDGNDTPNLPRCRTCKQTVYALPASLAGTKDFAIYCSDKCTPKGDNRPIREFDAPLVKR